MRDLLHLLFTVLVVLLVLVACRWLPWHAPAESPGDRFDCGQILCEFCQKGRNH